MPLRVYQSGQTIIAEDDNRVTYLTMDEAEAVAQFMSSGPRASRVADDHLAAHGELGRVFDTSPPTQARTFYVAGSDGATGAIVIALGSGGSSGKV